MGQEGCRWNVVCRGKFVAWVKRSVAGMWPVGSKSLRGSRELSTECGLSGRNRCVGQGNCWRYVVCRGKIAAWVKRAVGGVWSVGAKSLCGSRELSAECGLSGQNRCVGQEGCRWNVACQGEIAVWVKRAVAGVWPVGVKTASEPKNPLLYASNVANHHSDQNCQNSQNMIHLL